MMKKNIRHIGFLYLAAAICALSSCQKPSAEGPGPDMSSKIVFQVADTNGDLIGAETKADYNTGNIDKITVYGKAGTSGAFTSGDLIEVLRPQAGSIWKPQPVQVWNDEVIYNFHAYAHTQAKGDGSIVVSNNGKNVSLKQPSTYAYTDNQKKSSTTIDYLLSYSVNYQPSQLHQVVPVVLEHALTKVTLYVTRDQAMKDIEIKNLSISFKNIKNECALTCNKQKDINKDYETSNEWSYRFNEKSTANYTLSLATKTETDKYVPVKAVADQPFMSFIAIPNDHQGLENYILDLNYTVVYNQKERPYHQSYKLWDYTANWESGHHVTYSLDINSGITTLVGNIKDWIQVDYIEGTILPPIPDKDQVKPQKP